MTCPQGSPEPPDSGSRSLSTSEALGGSTVPGLGPSGLSDYAVSPLGMPVALLGGEVRVAVLARTSTEDQQDPRLSIMRQVGNCRSSLPEAWVIVATFYDVESGRMELDQRGRGTGYERFDIPIPRDGGIADLLAEAARSNRRFDVVICEGISRIARRAYEGLSVERELERAEVPLSLCQPAVRAGRGVCGVAWSGMGEAPGRRVIAEIKPSDQELRGVVLPVGIDRVQSCARRAR